jgi:hypothetical protein
MPGAGGFRVLNMFEERQWENLTGRALEDSGKKIFRIGVRLADRVGVDVNVGTPSCHGPSG